MTNSDTPAVRIADLGKTYPGAAQPALSGVSLNVEPGEIVVLLGLSGSGKSTLLARNVAPNGAVRNFFRGVALFIRAIPDLVVAILFIIAAGIGPQAGALALGIGGVGLLAKLIGDSMEEVPNGPERALAAAGGTRAQVFFSSTVPMSVPAMVGHLMYLLEQNIRSATLLGIVGAGGIGFLVLNALNGALRTSGGGRARRVMVGG